MAAPTPGRVADESRTLLKASSTPRKLIEALARGNGVGACDASPAFGQDKKGRLAARRSCTGRPPGPKPRRATNMLHLQAPPAGAPRAGDCRSSRAEINGVPGRPRCHPAQLEECQLRAATQSVGGDYRAEWLGQIFSRIRHHLRRGPAPLRRITVGLRSPVPRPVTE